MISGFGMACLPALSAAKFARRSERRSDQESKIESTLGHPALSLRAPQPALRVIGFLNGGSSTDRLLLDKRAIDLLRDRLRQIVHHGPAAGLHEDFGRHARDELQAK
jgi:hypothetical protein